MTAFKRVEGIQDISLYNSVVAVDELNKKWLYDFQDVARYVPNFNTLTGIVGRYGQPRLWGAQFTWRGM